jgi:hypothetical protein
MADRYIAKAGPVYWEGEHVATLTADVELGTGTPLTREHVRWPDGRELGPGEKFGLKEAVAISAKAGKRIPPDVVERVNSDYPYLTTPILDYRGGQVRVFGRLVEPRADD